MPSLYWPSGHHAHHCADKMVKCISRLAALYLFQILRALHYPASHLPSFQAVAVDASKSIMSLLVDPIGLPRTPPIDGRPLSARASVSPLATMIRRVWPHGPPSGETPSRPCNRRDGPYPTIHNGGEQVQKVSSPGQDTMDTDVSNTCRPTVKYFIATHQHKSTSCPHSKTTTSL